MNLVAAINVPVPHRRAHVRHYDVGDGRCLSVAQIARETGCTDCAIYERIAKGWTGADLLRPRRCYLYDVGNGLRLTIEQIAEVAGVRYATVHARLRRGWSGKELLLPSGDLRRQGMPRSTSMLVACKLAQAFPGRLPTVAQIRSAHPMSKGAAERYRIAMREALRQLEASRA